MKKDDSVYLHHILAAIERIETYSEGVSLQKFLETGIIQDGVVRQLEIIGEASRNLSAELIQSHPEVPWSEMWPVFSKKSKINRINKAGELLVLVGSRLMERNHQGWLLRPRGSLVVVEGRAPIWRRGMALHFLHGSPAAAEISWTQADAARI